MHPLKKSGKMSTLYIWERFSKLRRRNISKRGITGLFLTAAVFTSTFSSIEVASSEQVYKVRIGEIGVTDFFTVGWKSFKYTERGYNSYYGANIFIAPCTRAEDSDCIESLSYRVGNSLDWKNAELDLSWTIPETGIPLVGSDKGSSEKFVIKNRMATPADPENNYPAGGATSIWKVSQTGHNSNFRLFLNFNLNGTNPDPKSEKIVWKQFVTQVLPISKNDWLTSDGVPGGTADNTFGNISGIKVKVRVKILKQILNGWVHSRTTNPEISYGVDSGSREFVDFSGAPLSVPTAEAVMDATQYLSVWDHPYMKAKLNGVPATLPDARGLGGVGMWPSTSGIEEGELKMWSAYEPFFSKTAASISSLWKISGEGNLNLQKFNSSECVSEGKIDGILATNATQYAPSPPTFIESTQELSYQLAAPHFKVAAEEFKGTYSLVISQKLARCIWGSSLTNASAKVSILSSDGKTSVTTQTLKSSSGFYYFNISGFGFSAPTIRVKLAQNSASPTPTPQKSPVVKSTITCLKGKTTKKVTAVNPKCPAGYKKK
jgi:hypothetical protein